MNTRCTIALRALTVITMLLAAPHPGAGADPQNRYIYDDLGRLKQVIDQDGNAATYTYDERGNILSIDRGDGGCPVQAPEVASSTNGPCFAGGPCSFVVTGQGLLGAGVVADHPDAYVSDCRSECNRLACVLNVPAATPVGAIRFTITNQLGGAQASVSVGTPSFIETSGQPDQWHFAANAGQVITLSMNRVQDNANGTATLDPALEIRDSRNFLVAANDDGGDALPPGPGRNALIQNLTLPATDTYVVVARGAGGTTGPYFLQITPATIVLVEGAQAAGAAASADGRKR